MRVFIFDLVIGKWFTFNTQAEAAAHMQSTKSKFLVKNGKSFRPEWEHEAKDEQMRRYGLIFF